jgi:hypothetical protein
MAVHCTVKEFSSLALDFRTGLMFWRNTRGWTLPEVPGLLLLRLQFFGELLPFFSGRKPCIPVSRVSSANCVISAFLSILAVSA